MRGVERAETAGGLAVWRSRGLVSVWFPFCCRVLDMAVLVVNDSNIPDRYARSNAQNA